MAYIACGARLASKTYSIPTFTIPIGYWDRCTRGWVKKLVTITWDEARTTVTGARLVITEVHSDHDPVNLWVRWNGEDIKIFSWPEGTKCTPLSDVVDVTLLNGMNSVELSACKGWPYPAKVTVTFSGYVEVFYEGEEPERRPGEEWWQWLEANWPWLLLAGASVVAIGGVIYLVTRRS